MSIMDAPVEAPDVGLLAGAVGTSATSISSDIWLSTASSMKLVMTSTINFTLLTATEGRSVTTNSVISGLLIVLVSWTGT